jgi:hypothetical protein
MEGRSGGQLLTAEQLAHLKPITPYVPQPVKIRKRRRSRSMWAVNSRIQSTNLTSSAQ